MPDLVSGYGLPPGRGDRGGSGILTWHRGNVDALWPNSPDAQKHKKEGTFTNAPFLSPARVFPAPVAPDFLGVGDFDADGHCDVVVAAYGGHALYLLPGDGRGGLGAAHAITLPGRLTALVTGEVNRADGLMDVIVGVVAPDGPKVLVFEWPEGALRGEPEVFALPAEAIALARGQFDMDYPFDLVVAAGRELLIIHGRDRWLSVAELRRAATLAGPAAIDQRSFPFTITALVVGDFTGDYATELALLSDDGTVHVLDHSGVELSQFALPNPQSAIHNPQFVRTKISSLPGDDLVFVDRTNRQVQILMGAHLDASSRPAGSAAPRLPALVTLDIEGEPVAVLPMRLNADALSDLVILKQGESSGPAVAATASMATFTVNSTADTDDGTCDATDCTLREAINAANASAGADEIRFNIPGAGPHTIQPLTELPTVTDPVTIDGTTEPDFAGTPIIELDGSLAPAGTSGVNGLKITVGSSVVRGLVINRFKAATGFVGGSGIHLETNGSNIIEGNYIGTNVAGTSTTGFGNGGRGVGITGSPNNLIGGTTANARNVISGNLAHGVGLSIL